jgi:hypothetical protein
MSAIHGYNIYNAGVRAYSDTQSLNQSAAKTPAAAQSTTDTTKTVTTAAPNLAEKVSISNSGRAAVAQDKVAQASSTTSTASTNAATATPNKDLDRFTQGFAKTGHSKEEAAAAYSAYTAALSQQTNHGIAATTNTQATAPTATVASTPTQTVGATTVSANTTSGSTSGSASAPADNKDLNRFITGFTKSGHTKEQAISAYNTYAAIASQHATH